MNKLDQASFKPIAISKAGLEKYPNAEISDSYTKNLEELFLLRNPRYRFEKNYQSEFEVFKTEHPEGQWFYFPWLNQLVHFLPDAMHQELRTGRNRNLITAEEQKKYYDATVGILGMSVGSHVAVVIAMSGGARHIKLADPDLLSGDNLNRIRNGFQNVGTKKVILVARQIAEFNPYAEIEIFEEGLTEKNLDDFLSELSILVEEMDNPYFKIKVREQARDLGIPVVMAADNGDGVIADVERFDLDKTYPLLHGILGGATAQDFKSIAPQDLPQIIAKIAGANLAVPRMLESVKEVGKTLYSWPQLGTAANLCGSVLAYLARQIILKNSKIKSGRYQVSPELIFESA